MTLRDLFTDKNTWAKYGDMDVYNDCIDEMTAAWCGTLMTFEGAQHYDECYKSENGKLLDTPIEIAAGRYCNNIECKIDSYPDYFERWIAIDILFNDAAGYCSESDYDKWFIDDYDNEEAPEPDPYRTVINHMIDHTSLDQLKSMANEPEGDKFLKALEEIGFNVTLIREAK